MRKKVAVLVSNMYGNMINEMQEGLIEEALEQDIKLIFFASFSDGFSRQFYDQYIKYDEGDIVSFMLADLNDFDGVVFISDSFSFDYRARINELLKKVTVPVINVGKTENGKICLINDSDKSFNTVVEHVVTVHGCKDIYHVAGSKTSAYTAERLNSYRSVLEKYGLDASDEKIYYGNLWKDCGEPALDYILEDCAKNGKKYPDAIVCANDYSAVGVIDACRKKGIKVPKDVIVTGYDGIEDAFDGRPTITTARQPFSEMSKTALKALAKIWANEDYENLLSCSGELLLNQSCGCVSMEIDNTEEVRHKYSERMDKMMYLTQSTTNMILGISNSETLEMCFDQIEENAKADTGFKNFVLCLSPYWTKRMIVDDSFTNTDEEMHVVAGFLGDHSVNKGRFMRKQILPKELLDDPYPYYVCAVHHLQYYMGYVIMTPTLRTYDQLTMKSWFVNLGAMLENIRIREDLEISVNRLENLYNRDNLTGLYNRRGYDFFFPDYYEKAIRYDKNLAVLLIDMDDLKMVNDSYGHPDGDYSLNTIAEAMNKASRYGEICMRTGGDEFVVLALDYSQEKVEKFTKTLRNCIEERRERDKKHYPINVSVGSCIINPSRDDKRTIQEISEYVIRTADAEMYKEKKEHKSVRESDGLHKLIR